MLLPVRAWYIVKVIEIKAVDLIFLTALVVQNKSLVLESRRFVLGLDRLKFVLNFQEMIVLQFLLFLLWKVCIRIGHLKKPLLI